MRANTPAMMGSLSKKHGKFLKKICPTYLFESVAITGSKGELLSKQWQAPYFEEVITHARGAHRITTS